MVVLCHVGYRFRNHHIARFIGRANGPCAGRRTRLGAGARLGVLHGSDGQGIEAGIAKLRRDKYGISSERRARRIDQLELQLEELQLIATEDALAAEQAAAQDKTSTVHAFTRRKARAHTLPRTSVAPFSGM